jgi:hypothetical protein
MNENAIAAAAKAIEAVHGDYKPTAEDYRTMARAALAAAPPLRAREEDIHFLRSMSAAFKIEGKEYYSQRCQEIADALASTAGQEWRDIGSAPKDETGVLVCTDSGVVGEAKFHEDADRWYWMGFDPTDYCDGSIDIVTHWMPLPAPPVAEPIVAEEREVKS